MRVVITGSSGMLGADLCKVFKGIHETVGMDVMSSQGRGIEPDRFIEMDIKDASAVTDEMREIDPEVIIHAAAWADVDGCENDPDKAYKVNTDGTYNVATAAKDTGAIGIFISTDFVFDGRKETPYSEEDACSPVGVYAKSKYEAEKRVKDSGCEYIIVRTSWLFGKNGKNFVNTIKAAADGGKELRVVGDQTGSPTYTKDLAEALKVIVDKREGLKGNIFNVSNSGECSWCEFACNIVPGVRIYPISSEELARPAPRPAYSVLDNTKFEKMTGVNMRSWKEALKDYLEGEN